MLSLALIRPGATDYSEQSRVQGTLDIPLNPQGTDEVARTIGQLRDVKLIALYTSDSEPAASTAKAIAGEFGLRVRKLDGTKNLDHGLWQGMSLEEIKRKQPKVYRQWQEQPDSVCPPQGETLGEARQRLAAALTRLRKKHKEGVVAVVLPEPLFALFKAVAQDEAPGDLWKASTEHGGWEKIDLAVPQTT